MRNPKIEPPPCLGCGKPLRRYRYRTEAHLRWAQQARRQAERTDLIPHAKAYWLREAAREEALAKSVATTRQWGASGDNFFCHDACAYEFAVAVVRRHDERTLRLMRQAAAIAPKGGAA